MSQNHLEKCKVSASLSMYSSIPRVPNRVCFTLQPAVFELQAILRQMHWMTQDDLEHYHIKPYVIYVVLELPGPKYHSVSLYDQPFPKYLQLSYFPVEHNLKFQYFCHFFLHFKIPRSDVCWLSQKTAIKRLVEKES